MAIATPSCGFSFFCSTLQIMMYLGYSYLYFGFLYCTYILLSLNSFSVSWSLLLDEFIIHVNRNTFCFFQFALLIFLYLFNYKEFLPTERSICKTFLFIFLIVCGHNIFYCFIEPNDGLCKTICILFNEWIVLMTFWNLWLYPLNIQVFFR